MDFVTLGSTGITVNKNGFGALPIQRISETQAVHLLKKAFENGITFFDTAISYTDSEKKMGLALSHVRDKIFIATKTYAQRSDDLREHLKTSLSALNTDYIDIYQFHNHSFCPKPGDGTGLYEAMLEAKEQGKIRHIGITNHRLHIAREAADSGLYEIIQYPVSYLASDEELDFVRSCKDKNIGVLAMKALAGGLITNSAAAYAYLLQFDNILPIWGIQFEHELDEFIAYQVSPPVLNDENKRAIDHDILELKGEFCRGCGYCLPCPAEIDIPIAARILQLMQRAPETFWFNDHCSEGMKRVDNCTECGQCKKACPYNLDVPKLLRTGWAEFSKLL